jgi:hypothetical protein
MERVSVAECRNSQGLFLFGEFRFNVCGDFLFIAFIVL